jgi:hypothetical protein
LWLLTLCSYLGASFDVPSLVDKLLEQLASKRKIVVNLYDTTNHTSPIEMYGSDFTPSGDLHISSIDFGDPTRKHEMHCRYKTFFFDANYTMLLLFRYAQCFLFQTSLSDLNMNLHCHGLQ